MLVHLPQSALVTMDTTDHADHEASRGRRPLEVKEEVQSISGSDVPSC